MRYYGEEYGLNYGVSIPTIRALGRGETTDHRFAKYLFQQEVRELRAVSLWFADPTQVGEELEFWAKGIINTEIAEEAAFVLLSRVSNVTSWLESHSEILQYCAVMAVAGWQQIPLNEIKPQIIKLLEANPPLLSKAVIALLDRAIRENKNSEVINFMAEMPQNITCNNIREEISWRM